MLVLTAVAGDTCVTSRARASEGCGTGLQTRTSVEARLAVAWVHYCKHNLNLHLK